MAHEKKVSRQAPALIDFVIDDSGSMADNMPGTSTPKFQYVERNFGILLKELLGRSTEVRGDGTVAIKPRYYVRITPYGSSPTVMGLGLMDIEKAVEVFTQAGNSLGLGGKLGGTDADAALKMACADLKQDVADPRFRESFPPLVFHLTDGESQTDPSVVAQQIQSLSTSDGTVLMVNAFFGTHTSLGYQGPDDFPGYVDAGEAGPSNDNITLFNASSPIPASMHQNLTGDGIFPKLRPQSRLFFDVRTTHMLKAVIQVVGSIGSRAVK